MRAQIRQRECTHTQINIFKSVKSKSHLTCENQISNNRYECSSCSRLDFVFVVGSLYLNSIFCFGLNLLACLFFIDGNVGGRAAPSTLYIILSNNHLTLQLATYN